jgi:hypothetical protein
MHDIGAYGNEAVCHGLQCAAVGGFLQIQNGPEISLGQVPELPVEVFNMTLSGNKAHSYPALPEYTATTCNEKSAACTTPTYGGAIGIIALNGAVLFKGENMTYIDNSVFCSSSTSCITFGASVGASKETVPGSTQALLAEVDVNLLSSSFTCSNVSCIGTSCSALDTVWSTQFATTTSVPSLFVGGERCEFIGTGVPSGTGETVSSVCNVKRANDTEICFETSAPSASPTLYPTPSPASTESNGHVKLPAGAIVGIVLGPLFLIACCYLFNYYRWSMREKNTPTTALEMRDSNVSAIPTQSNPMHQSSTLRSGLLK